MTNKTHLISKVDELYRQIELKDREIEALKEKILANERNSLRTLNESIDVSKQASMTHLNKILREVEEIKTYIAIKVEFPSYRFILLEICSKEVLLSRKTCS
jgi:hypothetical protein